jgi:PAS domain S-box-containing protein
VLTFVPPLLKLPTLLRKSPAPAPPPGREGRLRGGFEQAPLGIAYVGRDGAWLQFNDRFAAIAGYTREQLARLAFSDITHPDDARREALFLRRLRAGEIPHCRIEMRIVDRRGTVRNVVATAALVRDAAGAPDFFVFIVEEAPVIERPQPFVSAQERAIVEQGRAIAEVRGQELRRTIDELRAEVARRERSLEEKTNELRIMTNALRKEMERRKAAEEKLVEEKLPTPRPSKWHPLVTTPAELLIAHGIAAQTGTLVIASGRREVEIFFESGKVFSVSSNDPSRFLTERLIALGIITEEQRQRALEIQRATHLALGRILTILGAVSEGQLIDVLRAKAEEEIAQVLRWRGAKYAFIEGDIPALQLVPMRIDVAVLVLSHVADELEDEVEIPPPPPPAPPATDLLVASPVARKVHRLSCGSARRLDEETRIMFTSVVDAARAGYAACRLCTPPIA